MVMVWAVEGVKGGSSQEGEQCELAVLCTQACLQLATSNLLSEHQPTLTGYNPLLQLNLQQPTSRLT